MNIQKFLVATSILALTATSASALDIANGIVGAPAGIATSTMSGFAGPLALELCLDDADADAVSGNVAFTITPTAQPANFPQNLLVTVTLPAGVTFSSTLGGSALFSDQSTLSTVQTGGLGGSSSATFNLSEANNSSDTLFFSLPIDVNGCPDGAGIEINVIDTQTNLAVEGDAVVNTNETTTMVGTGDDAVPVRLLPGCQSLLTTTITPADPEKEIELTDYTSLSNGILGTVETTVDGTILVDATTFATPALIDTIDYRVDVEDSTGLAAAVVAGGGSGSFAGENSVSISAPYAAGPRNVFVTADGVDAIVSQDVDIHSEVTFTAASGLVDKAPVYGDLDPLNREGAVFGRFDWVGANNGAGTVTILRVTGLPLGEAVPYTVNLINTPNGTYDGTYSGVIPANHDGEVGLDSHSLFDVDNPVNFVRGDAELCFETNAALDVDRLMTTSGGQVASFGDGSNFNVQATNPTTDFDNGNSTE